MLISFKMLKRSPYGGGKDLMEGGEEGAWVRTKSNGVCLWRCLDKSRYYAY